MNVESIAGQLGEGRTRCAPGPSSVLGLAGRLSDLLALTKPRVMMRNAPNNELVAESIDLLRRWSLDPEIGAIVVTGEGQAFCAGGDVSMMAHEADDHRTLEQQIDALRQSQELSWLLYNSPKVTIAAVNGHAMGASLGICPACDLRLAFDHARFGTAYANVELRRRFRNDLAARALRGHFQGQVVVLFVRDHRCNGSLSHWIGQPRGSRRTPVVGSRASHHESLTAR